MKSENVVLSTSHLAVVPRCSDISLCRRLFGLQVFKQFTACQGSASRPLWCHATYCFDSGRHLYALWKKDVSMDSVMPFLFKKIPTVSVWMIHAHTRL